MTDQIDMIYLKIFLYFGLYRNHLAIVKNVHLKKISVKRDLIILRLSKQYLIMVSVL